MDPIKLVKQLAFTGVITLIVMGAAGFYVGYSAGRADMSEMRAYLASVNLQAPAADGARPPLTAALDLSAAPDLSPVLNEVRSLGAQMRKLEKWAETNASFPDVGPLVSEVKGMSAQLRRLEASVDSKPAAASAPAAAPTDLNPVLTEVRAVSAQLKKLERPSQDAATPAPVLAEFKTLGEQLRKIEKAALQAAEAPREDPKLREEVGRLRQLAASAGEQANICQTKLNTLEARAFAATTAVARSTDDQPRAQQAAVESGATVVLYDSFYLKKDQNKQFDDVDLKVALQGVSSRSARVDVNNQTVSIAFGERKEIIYNNMTCELNLTETDLSASQARFNIACKK
jgi:hypothetical protein